MWRPFMLHSHSTRRAEEFTTLGGTVVTTEKQSGKPGREQKNSVLWFSHCTLFSFLNVSIFQPVRPLKYLWTPKSISLVSIAIILYFKWVELRHSICLRKQYLLMKKNIKSKVRVPLAALVKLHGPCSYFCLLMSTPLACSYCWCLWGHRIGFSPLK